MSALSDQRVLASHDQEDGSINVLLVADNLILSAGLQLLLKSHKAVNVEETTREKSIQSVSINDPDVVVLMVERYADLVLISQLHTTSRAPRILALLCSEDRYLKLNAIKHGAKGVLTDVDDPGMLFAAIHALHLQRTFVSPTLSHVLFAEFYQPLQSPAERLTSREYEIVECVCHGLLNKEVAEKLYISETTVKHHLRTIFAKLDVSNRAQLVAYSYKNGLVQP